MCISNEIDRTKLYCKCICAQTQIVRTILFSLMCDWNNKAVKERSNLVSIVSLFLVNFRSFLHLLCPKNQTLYQNPLSPAPGELLFISFMILIKRTAANAYQKGQMIQLECFLEFIFLCLFHLTMTQQKRLY